jgi:hypothetical protein
VAQPEKLPSIEEAVAELRKDPRRVVKARVDDLQVELKVVAQDDIMGDAGPWEGETTDELLRRLRDARLQDDAESQP